MGSNLAQGVSGQVVVSGGSAIPFPHLTHVSRETLNDLPGGNEMCRAARAERRARRKARMRLRKRRGWR